MYFEVYSEHNLSFLFQVDDLHSQWNEFPFDFL